MQDKINKFEQGKLNRLEDDILSAIDDDLTRSDLQGVITVAIKKAYWLNAKKYEAMQRLEYLRGEIEAERISYGEIAELQSLADYIDEGDVLLREWAGIPEFENE